MNSLALTAMNTARDRLINVRGHYKLVAQYAGMDYTWVSKFATGVMTNPTTLSLYRLENALDIVEAQIELATQQQEQ